MEACVIVPIVVTHVYSECVYRETMCDSYAYTFVWVTSNGPKAQMGSRRMYIKCLCVLLYDYIKIQLRAGLMTVSLLLVIMMIVWTCATSSVRLHVLGPSSGRLDPMKLETVKLQVVGYSWMDVRFSPALPLWTLGRRQCGVLGSS